MALDQEQTAEIKNTALSSANVKVPVKQVPVQEDNSFKGYTDRLAEILQMKNQDYGNSFNHAIDVYGRSMIGGRIYDKYKRIENMIVKHKDGLNDESLKDDLLDIAGYAILSLKYLEEHNG